MSRNKKWTAWLLIIVLVGSMWSGCAADAETVKNELNDMQRNSINMLNYLVVLTQEINSASNSRMYLEEVYSDLYNNTHPNAVDVRTQSEINYLFDTIEGYRMIAVKRERLQYIYEQNQAQALRDAVPNPLGLLSAAQSFDLRGLIMSVAYMAIDAKTSYDSGMAQADIQYLQDNWVLDDEQRNVLAAIRKSTFNYMMDTVRANNLPGELALNEAAVEKFVEWKNKENDISVIQYLESNKKTYEAFGAYWLELARRYYNTEQYQKCLDAIDAYEALNITIFRKDYMLAEVLTLAIVSAEQTMNSRQYEEAAARYADMIIENTDDADWALRYFAAQTYLKLHAMNSKTKYLQNAYLEKAYAVIVDNVNSLLEEQEVMNCEYMAEVEKAEIPKDATKELKAEFQNYNKMLVEDRKTALAPVSMPLLLNCELLFALMDEMNVPQSERVRIDNILHADGADLFLIESLDNLYRLNPENAVESKNIDVTFTGNAFSIPAQYVSEGAKIKVAVSREGVLHTFEDWQIIKVERVNKDDYGSFIATYTSKEAKEFKYSAEDFIVIEVQPEADSAVPALEFEYTAMNEKIAWLIDNVKFARVKR